MRLIQFAKMRKYSLHIIAEIRSCSLDMQLADHDMQILLTAAISNAGWQTLYEDVRMISVLKRMIDETFIRHNVSNMFKIFRRTLQIVTNANEYKHIYAHVTNDLKRTETNGNEWQRIYLKCFSSVCACWRWMVFVYVWGGLKAMQVDIHTDMSPIQLFTVDLKQQIKQTN